MKKKFLSKNDGDNRKKKMIVKMLWQFPIQTDNFLEYR